MNVPSSAPPVRVALDKFQRARADLANAREKEGASDAARRIYEGMAEVCNAYFRQTIPPLSSQRQETFPPEVAMLLAALLTNLLAGRLDESIRELVERPGARGRAFMEQEGIDAAVLYLQAVDAGLIEDRSPVQRVADWFKVSRATAQKWRREEARDLFSAFWPTATPASRINMITDRAKRGGERYAKDGRGHAAIAGRRAK